MILNTHNNSQMVCSSSFFVIIFCFLHANQFRLASKLYEEAWNCTPRSKLEVVGITFGTKMEITAHA